MNIPGNARTFIMIGTILFAASSMADTYSINQLQSTTIKHQNTLLYSLQSYHRAELELLAESHNATMVFDEEISKGYTEPPENPALTFNNRAIKAQQKAVKASNVSLYLFFFGLISQIIAIFKLNLKETNTDS